MPKLPDKRTEMEFVPAVSVIIPARNEEKNLPLLLKDLSRQTIPANEIICVDDASEDATAKIAAAYGARVISLVDKPGGWMGKAWACQNGAEDANSTLLLFLDADVRLSKDGIRKLIQAYLSHGCTVSVQPYHKTEKAYEQLSMVFNLVQIAANGTALPKPLNIGLYGPVIFIARTDYFKAGGHKSAKNSVVEDMALGFQLKKAGLPYRLFIGDNDIGFRMYGCGLRCLIQGWVKNLAAGAAKIPTPVLLMVFFWIASLISVPIQLIKAVVWADFLLIAVYSVLYIVWVSILFILSRHIGRFQLWARIFFPVHMLVLLGVFVVSMIKIVFRMKVVWKGRAFTAGEKQCE